MKPPAGHPDWPDDEGLCQGPAGAPCAGEFSVIRNTRLSADVHEIVFRCEHIAQRALPGQFLMVRPGNRIDPLLSRPLGVHGVDGDEISILVRIRGRGTEALAGVIPGDPLYVMGPLGRGFMLMEKGPYVLAAGGLGIAPIAFLAARLEESLLDYAVVWGARSMAEFPFSSVIEGLRPHIDLWTDDGSFGRKGTVAMGVEAALAGLEEKPKVIFSCGPPLMLRSVCRISHRNNIPCQVSVEERMACGIGACQGCVIPAKRGGYLKVCSDGPVFWSDAIFGHQVYGNEEGLNWLEIEEQKGEAKGGAGKPGE